MKEIKNKIFNIEDNYERIKTLNSRCFSSVSIEQSSQIEAYLESFSTKISGPQKKETQNFPIASSKEIEYEFSNFLNAVHQDMQFIFIFDELDRSLLLN